MSPFEYILPLVSVLVGLAIADLSVSLHHMLRVHQNIRWDWLPLATALLAVLSVLEVWWVFYTSQDAAFYTTLGGFLPFAAQLIILFLLNAAALPDNVSEGSLDLRNFYESNSAYFWSLYAVYTFFIICVRLVGFLSNNLPGASLLSLLFPLLIMTASVLLARLKNRLFHSISVIFLIGILLSEWWDLSLTP